METFLRDSEIILRKKLREVDELSAGLAQCNSDRTKLEKRKELGYTQFLKACDSRMKMKM